MFAIIVNEILFLMYCAYLSGNGFDIAGYVSQHVLLAHRSYSGSAGARPVSV